jgi:hypothetical protein
VDFIVRLEDSNVDRKRKGMFRIVKMHYDSCGNVACACHGYINSFEKDDNYY